MFIFGSLLILLSVIYTGGLLFLRRGLRKLKSGTSTKQPLVSIVIAARNEEANIGACLNAVLRQSYPEQKLEVIVIDDRSTDHTTEVIRQFSVWDRRVKFLKIDEPISGISPKKRALDLGIRRAEGEIIVTTDADCTPGPQWIRDLISQFTPEVGMVAGFNPYRIEGRRFRWLKEMLALDYFALACVAAASAGLSYPVSCSGGNLAYRKQLYLQLGGFKNIGRWVSGDDDFFLEQIREKTKWAIRYSVAPQSSVPTAPPSNLKEFIHQRIRYASKGRHYAPPVTAALAGVYTMNLLLAGGALLLPFHPLMSVFWGAAVTLKSLVELFFLKTGQAVFDYHVRASVYLFTAFLHPFYIVLAGLLGQVHGFRWKGETFSARIEETYSLTNS